MDFVANLLIWKSFAESTLKNKSISPERVPNCRMTNRPPTANRLQTTNRWLISIKFKLFSESFSIESRISHWRVNHFPSETINGWPKGYLGDAFARFLIHSHWASLSANFLHELSIQMFCKLSKNFYSVGHTKLAKFLLMIFYSSRSPDHAASEWISSMLVNGNEWKCANDLNKKRFIIMLISQHVH